MEETKKEENIYINVITIFPQKNIAEYKYPKFGEGQQACVVAVSINSLAAFGISLSSSKCTMNTSLWDAPAP